MGAIQNSIDQAVGAVAGAAIGVKHIKESEKANTLQSESQAIVAQGQAQEATEQAQKAEHEAKAPGGLLDQLSEVHMNLGLAKTSLEEAKNPAEALRRKSEVQKAQEAFDALDDKYQALVSMQDRAKVMREHAVKMTSISEEKTAQYNRRWGVK